MIVFFFLKERQRRNKDTKNKNKKTASNKRYSAPNNILRRTVTKSDFQRASRATVHSTKPYSLLVLLVRL